jgi:hypothetical protein
MAKKRMQDPKKLIKQGVFETWDKFVLFCIVLFIYYFFRSVGDKFVLVKKMCESRKTFVLVGK